MYIKNKTSQFQVIQGKVVRPFRTAEVPNETVVDKNIFEIVGEVKEDLPQPIKLKTKIIK
jgi:hypothetical protein